MREFSKVSPRVWRSERFMGLSSDDSKLLYLYLLTCEHQTSIGACHLPDGYACTDLRWEPRRYLKARQDLENAGLIDFDTKASVVAIKQWFRFNPAMNMKHAEGIARNIQRLALESPSIAQTVTADFHASSTAKTASTPPRTAAHMAMEGKWPVKATAAPNS